MILIKKSAEPASWTEHRLTEGAQYEATKDLRLSREEAMDFGNMVICCPGAMAATADGQTHCDRHKKETKISFSPLDANFISTISYGADGNHKEFRKEILGGDGFCPEFESVTSKTQSQSRMGQNNRNTWEKRLEKG